MVAIAKIDKDKRYKLLADSRRFDLAGAEGFTIAESSTIRHSAFGSSSGIVTLFFRMSTNCDF